MLTFKRGNIETLNNTEITKDMLYFTTDNNGIYMDSEDKRYKIFGININDSVITDNTSINTYYRTDAKFYTKNQIATDGNTSNKLIIGKGYYDNVIGDYQSYYNQPITATLAQLERAVSNHLNLLWTNSNPASTWSQSLLNNNSASNEDMSISISQSYFAYILLVQSFVGGATDDSKIIYPLVLFDLPKSIVNNESTISSIKSYGTVFYVYNHRSEQAEKRRKVYAELWTNITNNNNNKTLIITKKGKMIYDTASSQSYPVNYYNYLVPIALYGWSL